MAGKKERNHYDLKEIEHRRNGKIAWIAERHNVLTEMFAITERLAQLYKNVKLLTSLNPSRYHHLILMFCR